MITKIKNFINTRNGDTLNPLVLTFKKDGVEEDITDWTFYASINDLAGAEIKYFDMDEGLSIVNNKLNINFGETIQIPEGKYEFYLKVFNEQFGYQTILEGSFNVAPERVNNR